MNLSDLQREAHAIAEKHGWWDEKTTFGDRIERIHGALSEAGKASRATAFRGDLGWRYVPVLDDEDTDRIVGNKPVGVAAELADAVILAAGVAEHYGVDLAKTQEWFIAYDRPQSFGDWITGCHNTLSQTWWRRLKKDEGLITDRSEWKRGLPTVVRFIARLAAHYEIDLDPAIAAKMEYYRSRPYRHGGKAL